MKKEEFPEIGNKNIKIIWATRTRGYVNWELGTVGPYKSSFKLRPCPLSWVGGQVDWVLA